jgi:hypothetical protein
MAITGNLLTVNGAVLPGIKNYKLNSSLLWADAERNMSGQVRATRIGTDYPKIEVEFRDGLTQAQVQAIYNALIAPYFSVTFYDSMTGGTRTAQYYRGDYGVEILDKARGLFKAFNVNLIPVGSR